MPDMDWNAETWKIETRKTYDTVAADYQRLLKTELQGNPWDRGILGAFAGLAAPLGGSVLDLGCGTGRIAGFLAGQGLEVHGIDLSPGMIAVARAEYPGLDFSVGSLENLEAGDGSHAGVLAWYSIIHAPVEALPGIFAEMHRVLAPGGYALLAFQAGNESRTVSRAYGHDVSFTVNRLDPETVCGLLEAQGFTRYSSSLREPGPMETTSQAYLVMRKPRECKQ